MSDTTEAVKLGDLRQRVAFVLTGGAGYGAAQVGMLRALTESGVVPDLLVGVSAGALNAVGFASDPTLAGVDHLDRAWRRARRSQIFPLSVPALFLGAVGRRDHLVPSRGLRTWISEHLSVPRLEETTLPVHVVATDVASGEAVVLSDGDALDALLASCAIPAVFPPVSIGGRLLMDGGIAADTPIAQAEVLGATEIWVLSTFAGSQAAARPRTPVAMGLHAIGQLLGHAADDRTAGGATRATVHVLAAPPSSASNPFDLSGAGQLIDDAAELTRGRLKSLLELAVSA